VVRDALETIAILGTVVVVLVVVASFVLSTEITRPINSLAATMRGFTSGGNGPDVPHAGLREIDQLTISFNAMATDLDASTQSLKDANEELARRYQELADARHRFYGQPYGAFNHRSFRGTGQEFDGE
jgi:methyl-accepting chemotaxis protein